MYNFTKRFSVVLFIAFFLLLNLISNNAFAQLVTNGGFENSDLGDITTKGTKGWYIGIADGITPAPVFEIVSDVVEEGNRALKVTVHGVGTNPWDIQAVADSIPVKQNGVYEVSIWAKSQKAGLKINLTAGNYAYSQYASSTVTLNQSWRKISLQFTVSDNQKVVRAPIHFSFSSNADNAIYIDNVQVIDVNEAKKPVIVEAESGQLGSNFSVKHEGAINYVTPINDYTSQTSPGDTNRMITYQVKFNDSGYYNLFARIRVGSGGFNDDSFFYGRGFGEKNATSGTDWVFINGLASAGFTISTQVVNAIGGAGSQVWKWINLTEVSYSGSPVDSFYVSSDSLTKTFQIGSRENGLDIDKIAFGKTNLFYTVDELNNGLPGTTTSPEVDSSLIWKGPALATGQSKFLGNVKSQSDNDYAKYWNQLTPGNEGKWESIGGSKDTTKWNWTGLDSLYNYAKRNNIIFKDHTLIWGNQQPSWISTLDSTQQAFYIETWIRKVGQRYPNMDFVDVVNEPLTGHNPPDGLGSHANYKKALGGNGSTGWDWVIKAFQLAKKYLPNAKLLINDYGIINDNNATNSYLTIINLLKARGLIDGIGVQGHRFELENGDTATFKNNLNKLAATGLPIYISEFDLGNINDVGTPEDQTQLQLYKTVFPVLWRHPGVKGITLWGYIEGQMWQPTCYLIHYNNVARPAFTWLAQFIKDNPTDVKEITSTIPTDYNLEQNYPNPFNPSTTIRFSLSKASNVKLEIFNTLGQRVAVIVNNQIINAGSYEYNFDASMFASGVYFYRLEAGSFSASKKMVILK